MAGRKRKGGHLGGSGISGSEQEDNPVKRLRAILGSTVLGSRGLRPLGKRPPTSDDQLIRAFPGEAGSMLAHVRVGLPCKTVDITAGDFLGLLEGYTAEGFFTLGMSVACQERSNTGIIRPNVYAARPELLRKMLDGMNSVRSGGGDEDKALEEAFRRVSKGKEGGQLFSSSLAIFPLPPAVEPGERPRGHWIVVLVPGLDNACVMPERISIVVCRSSGDVQEERAAVAARLVTRFVEEKLKMRDGNEDSDLAVEGNILHISRPTDKKRDVDSGMMMVRLIQMAAETPADTLKWRDDTTLDSWGELNIGARMRWLKPITMLREQVVALVLSDVAARRPKVPKAARANISADHIARFPASRSDGEGPRGSSASRGGQSASSRTTTSPVHEPPLDHELPSSSGVGAGDSLDESDLEGSEGGDHLSETAGAMDEWDEAGIVGADGSLPEGDPLPELDPDEIGEPYSQLSDDGRRDRISKACIAEFIEDGLGMTPDWAWTKENVLRSFTPSRKLELARDDVDVVGEERALILSLDMDALRMSCSLDETHLLISSSAAIHVSKHVVLRHGAIRGGSYSFPVAGDGESENVKPQQVPNIRVATIKADHRLGDIGVNLLFMHGWYSLPAGERTRDVCRLASALQRDGYMTALSSTLTQLKDHPTMKHLIGGVSPTLQQLKMAQRGEVFALPLDYGARELFFGTLLEKLQQSFGLEGPRDPEDRPYFRLVFKSIGQKHMMREPLLQGLGADEVDGWNAHEEDPDEDDSDDPQSAESRFVKASLERFSDSLAEAIRSLIGEETPLMALSVDIGVEVQAARHGEQEPLVFLPDLNAWAGRGASSRGSPAVSERGRLGDVRMDIIHAYSLLGTDAAGSLSGRSQDGGLSIGWFAVPDGENPVPDFRRVGVKVYSGALYHYNHCSAGSVMANCLSNSPVSSLVEMIRVAALGGGKVSPKRFTSVKKKMKEVQTLARDCLSGLGNSCGGMRVEGTYDLYESDAGGWRLAHNILVAANDVLSEVLGYRRIGWGDMPDLFYAVRASEVERLAKANVDRALAAIRVGFDEAGESSAHSLPVGLVPSVGELLVQMEGKVFRRAVVGRMLLKGLDRFGHVGLLEGDLGFLSTPGGDSTAGSVLPPGFLIGCGGGRRKEGFRPGLRSFLKEFGKGIPRVGSAEVLLANGGGKLFELLQKVVDLLLEEMRATLYRNKLLLNRDAEGDADWLPNIRSVKKANAALDAATDTTSAKRLAVADIQAVPASRHLARMVRPVAGATVERLPTPAATLFSAIVHALGGSSMQNVHLSRWLELILEAVYAEQMGFALVPESHATRLFRRMGRLVKCDYSDATLEVERFGEAFPDAGLGGGLGDITEELLKVFTTVYESDHYGGYSPRPQGVGGRVVQGRQQSVGGRRHSRGAISRGARNPWKKVHHETQGENITNPVVILALCLGVDVKADVLSVYPSRSRTDVTGRNDQTKNTFARFKDAVLEILGCMSLAGREQGSMEAEALYAKAYRKASTVQSPGVFHVRPAMDLPKVPGRYGMTTRQLLAAACAVLHEAPWPSPQSNVVDLVRERMEAGDGSAARAFCDATSDPAAVITQAIYPSAKDPKTPDWVFSAWMATRGGNTASTNVVTAGSTERRLERDARAERRSQQSQLPTPGGSEDEEKLEPPDEEDPFELAEGGTGTEFGEEGLHGMRDDLSNGVGAASPADFDEVEGEAAGAGVLGLNLLEEDSESSLDRSTKSRDASRARAGSSDLSSGSSGATSAVALQPRDTPAPHERPKKLLRDFEQVPHGQRGILRDGARVDDVVSALKAKGEEWLRESKGSTFSGSEVSKMVPQLRCAGGRSSSVVEPEDTLGRRLREDGVKSCKTTGSHVIQRLMDILVNASILERSGKKYTLGSCITESSEGARGDHDVGQRSASDETSPNNPS